MVTNETTNPFAYLAPHQFVVLATLRRTGEAVPTTVWFAYDQGKVYITTGKNAGKTKRIRNNGQVTMVPSDRAGNLVGEPAVAGMAREANEAERPQAFAVLQAKYGEMFTRIAGQENPDRTYLIVTPVA